MALPGRRRRAGVVHPFSHPSPGHRVDLVPGVSARRNTQFCHGFAAICGPKTVVGGADGRG
jgi:hypothetical protein